MKSLQGRQFRKLGFPPPPLFFALFKPFLLLPQRLLNLQFKKGGELPLSRFLKSLKAGASWQSWSVPDMISRPHCPTCSRVTPRAGQELGWEGQHWPSCQTAMAFQTEEESDQEMGEGATAVER